MVPPLTVKEAAAESRAHKDTVLAACREYERSKGRAGLKNVQRVPNGRRFIHRDDLARWMDGLAPTRGARKFTAA